MKNVKLSVIILVLILALSAGCSAQKNFASDDTAYTSTETMPAEAPAAPSPEEAGLNYDTAGGTKYSAVSSDMQQKLVYTLTLEIETLDYDASVQTVQKLTSDFGGYVESASVGNDRISTDYDQLRYASFTLRIPADRLDEFEASCGSVGSVYDSSRFTENRTAEYIDLSARLTALKTEETTLLGLLEKAVDMEQIIALNTRLGEVRYEIESIESSLRNIDSLVTYSTVNLYISEVVKTTPVNETPRTFSERVSTRLDSTTSSFKSEIEDIGVYLIGEFPLTLVLFLIYALPWIILIIAVLLIVRAAVRSSRRRRGLPVKPTRRQRKKLAAEAAKPEQE